MLGQVSGGLVVVGCEVDCGEPGALAIGEPRELALTPGGSSTFVGRIGAPKGAAGVKVQALFVFVLRLGALLAPLADPPADPEIEPASPPDACPELMSVDEEPPECDCARRGKSEANGSGNRSVAEARADQFSDGADRRRPPAEASAGSGDPCTALDDPGSTFESPTALEVVDVLL
jgi:hypothetical protein